MYLLTRSPPSFCSQKCINNMIDGKLQCTCGEDMEIHNWTWSKANSSSDIRISNNNKDTLFHPLYSSGTAAVRGDSPFEPNLHYYWEIKMLSNLYGTDVMVGVGTSKIVFSDWKFTFTSMLGIDSQSWGYSYHGNIHHNQFVRKYGSHFGRGSVVGVHLDMCTGSLEYYVNRKPMGIAFKGLKGRELYPIVCSTAAQSAIRVTCSVSEEPSLQMKCLVFIAKHPILYRQYKEIPGLWRAYDRRYFWIVPTNEEEEKKRMAAEMSPVDYKNFIKRAKKLRAIRWVPEILRVREDRGASDRSESDTAAISSDDSAIQVSSPESSNSNSSTEGDFPGYPSTSKQTCDESQCKFRRTDRFMCISNCLLTDSKGFCSNCKFRMQIEDECLSDSSDS